MIVENDTTAGPRAETALPHSSFFFPTLLVSFFYPSRPWLLRCGFLHGFSSLLSSSTLLRVVFALLFSNLFCLLLSLSLHFRLSSSLLSSASLLLRCASKLSSPPVLNPYSPIRTLNLSNTKT
jgi:hypothetical protein